MEYESLVIYSINVYSIFVRYLIKYCVFFDSFKVEGICYFIYPYYQGI